MRRRDLGRTIPVTTFQTLYLLILLLTQWWSLELELFVAYVHT